MPLPLYAGLAGRLLTPLRKATRCTGTPRRAVLPRRGKHLRHAWPAPRVLVRGDSLLASPAGMQGSDEQPALHSVTGCTSKAVVPTLAREGGAPAQRASGSSGRQGTRGHSRRYQAGTWSRPRRVVIKGEGSEPGGNTRGVVTDRAPARPQGLDQQIYCARGHAANESKAPTLSLKSDRTACPRFAAKQGRLVLHAAASVFLETFRRAGLSTTPGASATRDTSQWR
jgi:hypothetical protein